MLPVVIVSQPESLDAVQSHPVPDVTPTEPVPDPAPTLAAPGDSDHVQAVDVPDFDARKFATVSAFWLCTRAVSAVAAEPVGVAGLPYVTLGFDRYAMRVHDDDFAVPGASFFYQCGYLIPHEAEALRGDNLGSRQFTATWNAGSQQWDLADSSAFLQGSVLQRWIGATIGSAVSGSPSTGTSAPAPIRSRRTPVWPSPSPSGCPVIAGGSVRSASIGGRSLPPRRAGAAGDPAAEPQPTASASAAVAAAFTWSRTAGRPRRPDLERCSPSR